MDHGPARIDDIGDVAFPFVFRGRQDRFAQAADNTQRVVEVQQHRADAVAAHRPDAVGQQQPTFGRFQRRTAIADLHKLPGIRGCRQQGGRFPEVNVVGVHDVQVLPVDARDHRVVAVDPPRKQRHAFVPGAGAVERMAVDLPKILGVQQHRQDTNAVIGGIGPVVRSRIVVVDESHQPQVFDAARLVVAHGIDHGVRNVRLGREFELVIRPCQQKEAFDSFLKERGAFFFFARVFDRVFQLREGKARGQSVQDALNGRRPDPHLAELPVEQRLEVELVRRQAGA